MADRTSNRLRDSVRAAWSVLGAILSACAGIYLFVVGKRLMEGDRAMAHAEAKQARNEKTAFEPTDWDVAPVAAIYVGILLLLVISCLVLILAYPHSLPDASRALRINPPGPRLQTHPQADLQRFRAEEDRRLNGYYWIDKQKGIVHVPIGQAMRKLAQTGIDGFPKAQP